MTKKCNIEAALGEQTVIISEFTYCKDLDGVCGLIPPGIIIEDIKHNLGRDLNESEREKLEQACFDHL